MIYGLNYIDVIDGLKTILIELQNSEMCPKYLSIQERIKNQFWKLTFDIHTMRKFSCIEPIKIHNSMTVPLLFFLPLAILASCSNII